MVLLLLEWVQVKVTVEEEDSTSEVLKGSVTSSCQLDFLYFSI